MRILVVSQVYYPEKFRINNITKELVKHGHDVTVLAGLPDIDPNWRIPKEYRYGKKRREEKDGVKIIRVATVARKRNPISLSLNYLSFAVNGYLYSLMNRMQYDVIFVYELTPVTMILPAIKAAKKSEAKILCYCLDIWPECVKVYGIKENSIFFPFIAQLSKFLYQHCDRIAVTSRPFFTYLNKKNNIDLEKMMYLPQDADDDLLNQEIVMTNNGIVDFLYVGNIGMAQNIQCIIEAVKHIKTQIPFLVHLVGDGYELDNCKKMVSDYQLEKKVLFYGSKYGGELLEFYKEADACLLTLKCDNYVGQTMPAKLQSYMAVGKPILGAISGAALDVIKEAQCGQCVEADDVLGLSEIMTDFCENPVNYSKCGENAKEYFKSNFAKDIFMNHLEDELYELRKLKGK